MNFRFHDFDMRYEYEIRVEDNPDARIAREEIAGLRTEIRGLRSEMLQKERRIAGLGDEIRGVRGEVRDMMEELGEARGEFLGLRNEAAQNRGDVRGLRQDNVRLRREILGLRNEEIQLRGAVRGFRQEVVEIRGEVVGLRGEVVGLRGEVVGLRGEVVGLRGEFVRELERRDAESARMGEGDLRRRVIESEAVGQTMRDDLENLRNRVEELTEENRGLMERLAWLEAPRPNVEAEIEPNGDETVDEVIEEKNERKGSRLQKFYTGRKRCSITKELALRIMEYAATT